MNALFLETGIIALLLLLNAIFSMSEMAIVSSRKSCLRQSAAAGSKGAAEALRLAESPGRFLSIIQIGMTLAAVLTGALGSAALTEHAKTLFAAQFGFGADAASVLGLLVVVTAITFLSVILGELVPKRLALKYPERIAAFTARPMSALARLMAPLVWVFTTATEFVLRLLRFHGDALGAGVTHEEIKAMVNQGAQEGALDRQEQLMMERVLSFGKRRVTTLMTPTRDMVWIDSLLPLEAQLDKLLATRFSHYPVAAGSLDLLQGTIQAKELFHLLVSKRNDLSSFLLPVLHVPETADALQLLQHLKKSGLQMGFVVDEFGSVEGIVTLKNVLEAIVGDLPVLGVLERPTIIQRRDGSWLVDGTTPVSLLRAHFSLHELEGEERNLFRTVAGFVMHRLGRVPVEGDGFTWRGWRFEIVDMDGNRIDKILMSPRRDSSSGQAAEADDPLPHAPSSPQGFEGGRRRSLHV